MIRLLAFDLDGTIGDTIPMCIAAFREAVEPYAGRELSDADIVRTFGLNEEGMIRQVVEGEAWRQALARFYAVYEEMHDLCPHPFAGMVDLIDEVRANGVLTALVTGKGKRSCEITLKRFGMDRRFERIATGSAEKQNDKADAMRVLLADFRLRPDELAYVGDTLSDVVACREAGVRCLSAAWAASPETVRELRQANEPFVFTSLASLRIYLAEAGVLPQEGNRRDR